LLVDVAADAAAGCCSCCCQSYWLLVAAWSWGSHRWHTLLPALSGHTVSLALFFNNVAWVSLLFLFYFAVFFPLLMTIAPFPSVSHNASLPRFKEKKEEEKCHTATEYATHAWG